MLTVTQKQFLNLLRRGHILEVQKRSQDCVSDFHGAEIGGRAIRFDAARKLVDQNLVEKIGEDGCTARYSISPMAVQMLNELPEARR